MEEMAKMIAIAKRFGGTGGGTSTVVVLEETTVTGEGELALGTPFNVQPEAGKTYMVTYNGTPYDCPGVAHDLDGVMGVLLGNAAMAEGSGGNEEAPFVIVVVPPAFVEQMGAYAAIYDASGATSVTLSITISSDQLEDSSGGNLIIMATPTPDDENTDAMMDKSFSETMTAIKAGKNVVVWLQDLNAYRVLYLTVFTETTIHFSATTYMLSASNTGLTWLQDGTVTISKNS